MSKRPPGQLQEQPTTKRINLEGQNAVNTTSEAALHAGSTYGFDDHDSRATFKAFQIPYVSDFPEALLEIVDVCYGQDAYNKTISIVQSSGTGKSRGVAEAAQLRFSFLFNLRRSVKYYAYPPPDIGVRDYLKQVTEEAIQKRYAAFLCSLFTCAVKLLSKVDRQGVPLAKWWYDHLNAEATQFAPAPNRSEFYKAVIEEAKLYESKDQDLTTTLRSSCAEFVAFLQSEYKRDNQSEHSPLIVCLLVFDEAQELADLQDHWNWSHFHHLGLVLRKLVEYRMFSVFLSTNSNIRSFDATVPPHPSGSQVPDNQLHSPITRLPFDVFAKDLYNELRKDGRSTLSATCSFDVIVRFGRAMWYSLYKTGYSSVILLAMAELNPTQNFLDDNLAQFACLAIRIGLDLNASREIGRKKEAELVESYTRVVFAYPRHWGYMQTGTPSEPVLAEAAARLLNNVDNHPLDGLAPYVLDGAYKQGFLARGERREMVARLLWTLAHDRVLRKDIHNNDIIKFHRPILLVDFLSALFHGGDWEMIRHAKPVGDDQGPSLQEAFKDAYIHFSHFMDSMEVDIELHQVYRLLLRGAALNCRRNLRPIDFLTPILFGHPDSTTISRSNTSILQAQVNNKGGQPYVYPVNGSHPVLSIVHQLGTTDKTSVECTRALESGEELHARHYQIICHGCTSKTYAVIPRFMDGFYSALLGSNSLAEDFPRNDMELSRRLFRQLNPINELEPVEQRQSGQQGEPGQQDETWSWFGNNVE